MSAPAREEVSRVLADTEAWQEDLGSTVLDTQTGANVGRVLADDLDVLLAAARAWLAQRPARAEDLRDALLTEMAPPESVRQIEGALVAWVWFRAARWAERRLGIAPATDDAPGGAGGGE